MREFPKHFLPFFQVFTFHHLVERKSNEKAFSFVVISNGLPNSLCNRRMFFCLAWKKYLFTLGNHVLPHSSVSPEVIRSREGFCVEILTCQRDLEETLI